MTCEGMTYNLLVVAKLEAVLHDAFAIPVCKRRQNKRCISLGRANREKDVQRKAAWEDGTRTS